MNYKSHILSLTVCLIPTSTFAQVEQDIIRPSINADQFGIGAKVETALSNGQVSLDIPLMELKGRGYDLPVSLAFYNGDVTFCTEASPIGLGWSLMAGGVITRTIKGADDTDNSNNHEHFTDDSYIENRYNDQNNYDTFIDDITMDPMPDEYTYSLPGHNGTIDVSSNNGTISMKLYPDESYTIEITGSGYCITADDGTKFYFEDVEFCSSSNENISTSWFLSRIVTTKGGTFTFNYADEEYVDLPSGENGLYFAKYITKRITSIFSDFGSINFNATLRDDRYGIGNKTITEDLRSRRINQIVLRDENGDFVKGYELDNSGLVNYCFASQYDPWYCFRHKLSSITQYDETGNILPPYEFVYDYEFFSPRLTVTSHTISETSYDPCNSWTSSVGWQVHVNLNENGEPSCTMIYPNSPYTYFEGISFNQEVTSATQNDYFCLSSITYPTGTKDEFSYEPHDYLMVNNTTSASPNNICIHGKRLASKTRIGTNLNQKTEYIYKKHDSNYNARSFSSGVMTNPSIHGATYYTPEIDARSWRFTATRVTSDNAFNSFMGPPVYYTEVEEVEIDENDIESNIQCRTIHYFGHRTVSPPVNYIFVKSSTNRAQNLIKIENQILGTKSGYSNQMLYMNNNNYTYLTYPVGEFTDFSPIGSQPLKEIFIGKDGRVRTKR